MSIASKLAKLVIKKGGTLSADEDSVEEILAKLIELEDGGNPPSGSGDGTFIIDCTVSYEGEDEEGVYAIDKTLEEINAAYNAGKALLLKRTDVYDGERSEESTWYYLSYAEYNSYSFSGADNMYNLSNAYISIEDDDGLWVHGGEEKVSSFLIPPGIMASADGQGTWEDGLPLTWTCDDPSFDPSNPGQYFDNLCTQSRRGITVRASRQAEQSPLYQYWDFPMIQCNQYSFQFGRFHCDAAGNLYYFGIYVSGNISHSVARTIISTSGN